MNIKIKRVTAIAVALLMPYVIGAKKTDDSIILKDNKATYGVTSSSNKIEDEVIKFEDMKAYLNEDLYNTSFSLDKYEKVDVLESVNDNYLIRDEENNEGYIDKDFLTVLPDTYIEVDIDEQILKLYKDNEEVLSSNIVTGKNETPTDLGSYEITYKDRDVTLEGSNGDGTNYASFVSYWMPFNGGEGFHDATWRDEFGGSIYEYSGSHGCVNMPYTAAEELYSEVDAGTKVLIHR